MCVASFSVAKCADSVSGAFRFCFKLCFSSIIIGLRLWWRGPRVELYVASRMSKVAAAIWPLPVRMYCLHLEIRSSHSAEAVEAIGHLDRIVIGGVTEHQTYYGLVFSRTGVEGMPVHLDKRSRKAQPVLRTTYGSGVQFPSKATQIYDHIALTLAGSF